MTAAAGAAAARVRWTARGLVEAISAAGLYVAPLAFALLVLIMWLPFGPRNGMPYETGFPYSSETTSWFAGFFYRGDDLRPYTSVFYHLAYLIGQHTGHAGSFVPYQLVYAALWWARGLLVFLILVPFFERNSVVPFLAGALTIVHASDHALNWVGQLNQFGMIFWLLLAIWLLVRSLLAKHIASAGVLCFGAVCAVYMCLWSYESGLFIIVLTPILVVLFRPAFRSFDRLALVGIFYIVPAYYIVLSFDRYVGGTGSTYQEAVSRDDLSVGTLSSDLVFNVRTSLEFWNWGEQMPSASSHSMRLLGAGAAAAILGVGGLMYWRRRETLHERRALVALAATGALLLVLSFPAYLLLTSARLVWRTQFLSGIGFGVMAAALAVLAATFVRNRAVSLLVALGLAATVSYFGAAASYKEAHFHYGIWLRHKHAIEEVLEAAPHLKPETVVVYTGVPSTADPFGDTMWFDMALRLAYPNVPLAGIYFRDGGAPAPGASLKLRRGFWEKTDKGYPPLIEHIPLARTLFIRYSTGETQTLAHLPSFLARAAGAARYVPRLVADKQPPDERALRRYGPLDLRERSNAG
jgi:hypothetical protein